MLNTKFGHIDSNNPRSTTPPIRQSGLIRNLKTQLKDAMQTWEDKSERADETHQQNEIRMPLNLNGLTNKSNFATFI